MRKLPDSAQQTCSNTAPIREVIQRIDASTPLLFQIILDPDARVVGTVTDGDIRRGFARGLQLEDPIKSCMRTSPVVGRIGDDAHNAKILHGRRFLPVCDADGRLDHILVEAIGPRRAERALVMAGGFGTRLGTRTKTVPKPLLPVAGKPILEHILERLEDYGIQRVEISVHYLADQIRQFVESRDNKCDVALVHEKEPLGTAGSLGLIDRPTVDPILTLNADVLTDVDLNAMIDHHRRIGCDGTVAASRYEYKVPYGVLRFDDSDTLQGIEEKPTYYHLVSAGIYYLSPAIVGLVDRGRRIDMPDLLERAVAHDLRLSVFPVHEYWSDVGHVSDLEDADAFHRERVEGK